jgi:hypothetical protein
MVVYNFKRIQPVPTNKDFVDIVLTRTQRKTPTVIHANFEISRIRGFYMRKVKFTQNTFHDKLTAILEEFPKLDVCRRWCFDARESRRLADCGVAARRWGDGWRRWAHGGSLAGLLSPPTAWREPAAEACRSI